MIAINSRRTVPSVKQGVHPKYQVATVNCACGSTWTTRSTRAVVNVDVCSTCHPFYTGEQRIVDTAGQVERFNRRVQGAQAQPRRKKAERRDEKLEQRRRLEEMRRNEEEVELAIADAPPRRGSASAAQLAAAMAGVDEPDTTIDEAAAEPVVVDASATTEAPVASPTPADTEPEAE
jgi:large subunit ribosomal protein L31